VVRIKVCGITRLADARFAESVGVHALGFVFAPSKRRVTPEQAAAIARALGPLVLRVGVFVDAPAEEVLEVAEFVGLTAVQLHGDEPPEVAREIGRRLPVVKAFRLSGPPQPALFDYPADAWLLDGPRPGSGQRFAWDWLASVPSEKRVIVAGGLDPENVCELLRKYTPYALDVSSGVEAAPGVKDHRRIAAFVRAVQACG